MADRSALRAELGSGDEPLSVFSVGGSGVGSPLLRRAIEALPRSLQGACRSFAEPRLAAGAEGGGTVGPMSPSGASSRSTITGA
jgi:hypothetical protein